MIGAIGRVSWKYAKNGLSERELFALASLAYAFLKILPEGP
jgi:hypothetical protein